MRGLCGGYRDACRYVLLAQGQLPHRVPAYRHRLFAVWLTAVIGRSLLVYRCWQDTATHLDPGIHTHTHEWDSRTCSKKEKPRRGARAGQGRERASGGDHAPVVGSGLRHGGGKGKGKGNGKGDAQRDAGAPPASQWQMAPNSRGSKRRQDSPDRHAAAQQPRQPQQQQQAARAPQAQEYQQFNEQVSAEEAQRWWQQQQQQMQHQQMQLQPQQQPQQPQPPQMGPPPQHVQSQPPLPQQPRPPQMPPPMQAQQGQGQPLPPQAAMGPPPLAPPAHIGAMYAQQAGVAPTPYMGPPPPAGWAGVHMSNPYAALDPEGMEARAGPPAGQRPSEGPGTSRSRQPDRTERHEDPARDRSREMHGDDRSASPAARSTEHMRAQVGSGAGHGGQGAHSEWT